MQMSKFLAIFLSTVVFFGVAALPAFAEPETPTYERIEPKAITDHLYEVQYSRWNPEKAEVIGRCLAKPALDSDIGSVTLSEEEKQSVNDALNGYFHVSEDDISSFIDYVTHEYAEQEYLDFVSKFIGDHIKDESALYILSQVYNPANSPEEFVSFLLQLNELGKFYEETALAIWRDLLENINALTPYACTSCRTGDIIGRNFDWVYDDVDEFIMRVPAAEGRYASIGVATGYFPPETQELIKINDILPMLTMDGINEKGVAINVNVTASSDLADKIGVKEYTLAYTAGTNPNRDDPFDSSRDVCAGYVVREILDHADSAEKAVEILTQEKNIYSIKNQEFHWMISDENATYIAECIDNQWVVLKTKENDEKHQAAMSNFHVTHSPHLAEYDVKTGDGKVSPDYTKLPMGIERYESVKSGLSDIQDEEAMLSNMRAVWYMDKIYKAGNEHFKSDMNMHIWKDSAGTSHVFTYGDDDIEGSSAARNEAFRENREEKLPKALEREKNDPEHRRQRQGDDPNGVLQTVHTSVYNLKEQTLLVNVQERKTTFAFALSDNFDGN